MAALNFPSSPVIGDLHPENDRVFVYTGTIWKPVLNPFPIPLAGAPRLWNQNSRTYWFNTVTSLWEVLPLDPAIAQVAFLCHFEEFGLPGPVRNRGSVTGTPVILSPCLLDGTQTKFSATSLCMPTVGGAGSCVFPNAAGFGAGTNDFCLEFWGYLTSTSASQIWDMRASNVDNSTAKPVVYINTGSEIFYHHTGVGRIAGGAGSWPLNQWNHGVVQRIAGVTRLFVNGAQKGANYTDSTNYPAALISLGAVSVGVAASMQGWMQEARFTIGNLAGRYSTAGFTPPTVPFSNY